MSHELFSSFHQKSTDIILISPKNNNNNKEKCGYLLEAPLEGLVRDLSTQGVLCHGEIKHLI